MKPIALLTTLATILLAVSTHAGIVLDRRAKLETDDARAAFDATIDQTYGTGVVARLLASADPEDVELAKLFIEGKLLPAGVLLISWKNVPKDQWPAVINHIAGKQEITAADTRAIWEMTRNHEKWPQLEPRQAEILAHYPDTSLPHYYLKYTKLGGLKGATSYLRRMTPAELMKVTAGIIPANDYDLIRQEVLARCIGAMTRHRRANGLPNDSASFTAAMQPIVDALNAPLWEGLQQQASAIGLDFTAPDYGALAEELTLRNADLDECRITTAASFAGSMMFWKGTEGYKAWTQNYTQQ